MKSEEIELAFMALNDLLAKAEVIGEIGVVGGAAMVLAYHAREATRDVDAIFVPSQEVREAAMTVANMLSLPDDWLNDGVKGFFPNKKPTKRTLLKLPNLLVWTPEPEYMLAMKAVSARVDTKDADDLSFLIRLCGLSSAEEVFIGQYYPQGRILAKVQYFVEELFEEKTP